MEAGELRTERLRLRPIAPSDAAFFVEALADRRIWRWLTRVPNPYRMEDALAFIATVKGPLTIFNDDRPLGVIEGGNELGYWLVPEAWGRGLMQEAATAVIDSFFADPSNKAMFASYFVGNDRSRKLLQRLGFRDIGPRTLTCLADGRTHIPGRQTRLSRDEWLSHPPDFTHAPLPQLRGSR